MWTYFAFIIAATIVSAERRDCVACIDGFCYDKPALSGVEGYYRAIDMTRNMLYLTQNEDGYTIKACDLDTEVCTVTNNSYHISVLTVDPSTGDIYALGDLRWNIYKLDLVNDTQTVVLRTHAHSMFYKDKIYYSSSDNRGIYTFVDGQSTVIEPTKEYYVGDFIIDKHDHMYFYDRHNRSIKWMNNGVIRPTDLRDGFNFMMTLDNKGTAMFHNLDKRVLYRASNGRCAVVGAFKDKYMLWLLFDRDNNIVYCNGTYYRNVVYLKREGNRTCTINGENEIETSDEENDNNDWFLPTIDEFSTQSSDDIDDSSNHNKVLTNGSILLFEDEGSGVGLASAASAEYYSGWIILSVMVIISYKL